MSEGTAALRGAAGRWSLAGDQQLLDLLQEIHQRIISKCNETNQRLEEMARGLRDASVNLQNVNNKFLALSNTQFVESRVYEDDTDVATPAGGEKVPPKPADLSSELSKLKKSLQTLESYHEPLLIVGDSDESDSEDGDDRLVLKPKDLYSDRPLPYIIGSHAWRNKWHAGLVPDESDSDSSTSKVEEPEVYSDSEDETRPEVTHYVPARKISSDSCSQQSAMPVSVSPVRPSPSAVAAELARRLGGDLAIPEREPVYTGPEPVVRKLYKPQEPLATTIFPDEPPPLDDASSDDDIFAELHKTEPKAHSNRVDDLFNFNKPSGLEEALFGGPKVQTSQVIDRPLFGEDSEPEVTVTPRIPDKEQPEDNVKKPVGGISVFGTNKHAESIGAAILKRNRRKSSTSGDESNTEEVKVVEEKHAEEVSELKKERDIFDDLFAKSEKLNKKNAKPEVVQTKEVKKKDVFSDIFDDIDDIFSSDIVNVKIKETKKNEKSLFSDDDDLFAEISKVNKDEKIEVLPGKKSDLFSEVTPKVEKVKPKRKDLVTAVTSKEEKREVKKENKVLKEVKTTKGLFDSDSDDGLFTNVKNDAKQNRNNTEKPIEYKLKDDLFDDGEDDELFSKKANTVSKTKAADTKTVAKDTAVSKSALFDSDEELFKDTKTAKDVRPQDFQFRNNSINNLVLNVKDDDQLFTTAVNKSRAETKKPDIIKEIIVKSDDSIKSKEIVSENPTVADIINNDEIPEYPKESHLETSHDSFDDEEPYSNKSKTDNNDAKEITTLTTAKTSTLDKDSRDNESTVPISNNMFGKSNEQTYNKENILRTTRIGSEEEATSTKIQVKEIVNDSDADLFRNTPKMRADGDGTQTDRVPNPAVPETPDSPNKKDIFSDIFDDVPPIFEKPKEPKKSKNVNALFDDDSDDEALFFKKSDPITDEKPTFNPTDERFGIFHDEPPAVDVDFTQKSSKHEDVKQTLRKTDEILPILDKTDGLTTKSEEADDSASYKSDKDTDTVRSRETQDTTDNTNKEPKKVGKLRAMNFNINVNTLLPGASPKKKQIENTEVHTASNEELHKTDKIEQKMVKSISFDDPEILDNKLSKERAKIQVKRRPSTRRARKEAVRKSAIDFTDSSLESSDYNKEEAKEKIVKTVYILNDDDIFGAANTQDRSTEHTKKHLNIVDSDEELFKNSKQIDKNDDVDRSNDNTHVQSAADERKSSVDSSDSEDLFKKPSNPTDIAKDEMDAAQYKDVQDKVKTGLCSNENLLKTKNEDTNHESSKVAESNKSFLDSDDDDDLFKQTNKTTTVPDRNEPNLDTKEERFRNPPINEVNNDEIKPNKSFWNSDDDDDLFKTKITKEVVKPALKSNISSDEEDLFKNKGVGTLGKVYKKTEVNTKVKESHSIFDDFPAKSSKADENYASDTISHSKTTAKKQIVDKSVKEIIKPAAKKSILDDLSDEDDLFKSKTKLLSRNNKSIFGDDDGDDNLFGSKPAKQVKKEIPVALPTKESMAAEPVFVDPLSLFGEEE